MPAVQYDSAQGAHTIDALDRAIVWPLAPAIGATLLVGSFAVTRVTRWLHAMAHVARRISAGDLDARVDDPRTQDPTRPQDGVAAVAGAPDTIASSLQSKLLREQRFTADVAHELRTPADRVAGGGRSCCRRAADRAGARPRGRAGHADRDLLEISRLDARSERLELDSEVLAPPAGRVMRASGTDTEVRVVRDARVATDRRRLERVLGNLVANAHQHGKGPVVLTVDGPAVPVRDHGEGDPEYLVTHGPQRLPHGGRFRRGTGSG